MILLIDVGNCRIKYATLGDGDAAGEFVYRHAVVWDEKFYNAPTLGARCGFDALGDLSAVVVSNVAKMKIADALNEYSQSTWGVVPIFISAAAAGYGVINDYQPPARLGCDRWAALVAVANEVGNKTAVVVDAGTAVSVDLLARGRFRGGVILPGVAMMQKAVSARVDNINSGGDARAVNAVATDTDAAVASGALFAVAGGIDMAIKKQTRIAKPDCVIISGGDAGLLAPLLEFETQVVAELVLLGLAVIARASL